MTAPPVDRRGRVWRLLLAFLRRFGVATSCRLSDLAPGERVRVRGRVAPRDLLDSPLAGDRCVYYRYTVDSWKDSPLAGVKAGGYWAIDEQDEAIVEFYLDDGDARVLVSPVAARVTDGTPRVVDLGEQVRRARELVILPGDTIEVVGRVAEALDLHDESVGYRADRRRLALVEVRIRAPGS